MTPPTEPARIAVLDIGKTNLKLLVASEDGWPLETHSIPNAANTSGPYLAYDLDRLEEWFLDALAKVSQRHAIGAVIATVVFLGIVYPFIWLRSRRRGVAFEPPQIPFGVFLAPAAVIALLWGNSMVSVYSNSMGL